MNIKSMVYLCYKPEYNYYFLSDAVHFLLNYTIILYLETGNTLYFIAIKKKLKEEMDELYACRYRRIVLYMASGKENCE